MSNTISETRQETGKQSTNMMMQAVLSEKYGNPREVLEFREVSRPVPKDDEVFVKIYAASVNPADWYALKGGMARLFGTGIRRPKDPSRGTDFAGIVEAVGRNVTRFKIGDEIFGGCKTGSYAEYGCAREIRAALKPTNMSFEEAAGITIAGVTALQALRDKGHIRPGQKVLINGASGGVGMYAVQIAKSYDTEVTAVCSTRNVETVRSLGADHVIDYTKEDFAKSGQRYDLICDIAATHSISDYKRLLNPGATFVLVGSPNKILRRLVYYLIMGRLRLRRDKKFDFFIAKINAEDLDYLRGLAEKGMLRTVIDRRYSLKETADAMEYLGMKHAHGKIIINTTDEKHGKFTGPVSSGMGWTVRF